MIKPMIRLVAGLVATAGVLAAVLAYPTSTGAAGATSPTAASPPAVTAPTVHHHGSPRGVPGGIRR